MTPLELVRAKVDRAKEHVNYLKVLSKKFLDSSPYKVQANHNNQTGEHEWFLTEAADIPADISLVAGDALQNMRSTLDHLVWQLIIVNNQAPKPGITGFPITETAQEYTTAKIRRKINGLSRTAESAIDALKPYKGGNDPLWRLHCMNNIDKHRLILSAASVMALHHLLPSQKREITQMFFGSNPTATSPPDLTNLFIKPATATFPLEVGKKFFSLPQSEMENDFTFRLGIAFNEPGIVQGESIVDTIQQLFGLVDNIVNIFAPLL